MVMFSARGHGRLSWAEAIAGIVLAFLALFFIMQGANFLAPLLQTAGLLIAPKSAGNIPILYWQVLGVGVVMVVGFTIVAILFNQILAYRYRRPEVQIPSWLGLPLVIIAGAILLYLVSRW